MRIGKAGWVLVIAVLAGTAWQFWPKLQSYIFPSFTKSTEDSSAFFRLKASYLHDQDRIDFDIVAGCRVRITNYQDSDSSFDASRDPLFFVKATQDGAAILQIVPNACSGETAENGRVPSDFLPGVIWYDDKDDRTLGIAYVTEEAFANPRAKLKFLGATITAATRAEWEAFQPTNAQNLADPRAYNRGVKNPPTEEEQRKFLWDKEKLARWHPHFSCYGMKKFTLADEEAQRQLRLAWPISKPRYWIPTDAESAILEKELFAPDKVRDLILAGGPYAYYIYDYNQAGFPTKARGGRIRAGSSWGSPLSAEILPVRTDIGLPWMNREISEAPELFFDIDAGTPQAAGNLYCYSVWQGSEIHMPGYFSRKFTTRIDGAVVTTNDASMSAWPQGPRPFFERDTAFYIPFEFSLD